MADKYPQMSRSVPPISFGYGFTAVLILPDSSGVEDESKDLQADRPCDIIICLEGDPRC